MRILLAAMLAALCCAATASAATDGWPPLRTAGPFLVHEVQVKTSGRWGEAWRTLYPPHQRVAPRAAYVRCERETPFPAPLRRLRVLRVRRTLVTVSGASAPLPGVAVTLQVGLRDGREAVVFTHTFHLVPVHGRWTWILSPSRYRLYEHDDCAAATGPAV